MERERERESIIFTNLNLGNLIFKISIKNQFYLINLIDIISIII